MSAPYEDHVAERERVEASHRATKTRAAEDAARREAELERLRAEAAALDAPLTATEPARSQGPRQAVALDQRADDGALIATAWGETKTIDAWSEDARCSVTPAAIRWRLGKGWPVEDAIGSPAYSRMADRRMCAASRADGQRCMARPKVGSEFCGLHQPPKSRPGQHMLAVEKCMGMKKGEPKVLGELVAKPAEPPRPAPKPHEVVNQPSRIKLERGVTLRLEVNGLAITIEVH